MEVIRTPAHRVSGLPPAGYYRAERTIDQIRVLSRPKDAGTAWISYPLDHLYEVPLGQRSPRSHLGK
jgi:hypothetical protein